MQIERPASPPPEHIAAVDLGSNSFHMVIAERQDRELKLIDRLREQVRLAEDLDNARMIGEGAQERALDCLRRFSQRLAGLPPERIRIVGTNVLRSARNAAGFLERAEEVLGHPIEIVSGIEEARLIYNGVAHTLAPDSESNRLVVDIGGGSTELIIGRGFIPLVLESLHMGCVTLSNRFFADGRITRDGFDRAMLEARLELEPKVRLYRKHGWNSAVGASGTILAVNKVLAANDWDKDGITHAGLCRLVDVLLKAGHVDALKLEGLSHDRNSIFPGGIVILLSVFEALEVEKMHVSDGALREGLLYDMVGRHYTDDVRAASVSALATRYHVDAQQAARVEATALKCLRMVAQAWKLDEDECASWLRWGAQLHEIGLDIAHSRYQHHGAYIIEHADLAGFSLQEQQLLALLVLAHRRKLPAKAFKDIRITMGRTADRLALLLRLATLLHRSRNTAPPPDFRIEGKKKSLALRFPDGWLDAHPLTRADLEHEAMYVGQIGMTLKFD